MAEVDEFEKSMEDYLNAVEKEESIAGNDFLPTKTVTLFFDYDEWGFGYAKDIATDAIAVEKLGGFQVSIELQWNEEMETYYLPNSGSLYQCNQHGFCYLVSAVAKEANLSMAGALMCICLVFRAKDIPTPAIIGTPLEWVINSNHKCEKEFMRTLVNAKIISQGEA